MQEKIEKAIEEGHVADEDWGGVIFQSNALLTRSDFIKDIEMNRAGKNGYRTLESKRAKKQEAQVSRRCAFAKALPNQYLR